jgi:hypothetical protein
MAATVDESTPPDMATAMVLLKGIGSQLPVSQTSDKAVSRNTAGNKTAS